MCVCVCGCVGAGVGEGVCAYVCMCMSPFVCCFDKSKCNIITFGCMVFFGNTPECVLGNQGPCQIRLETCQKSINGHIYCDKTKFKKHTLSSFHNSFYLVYTLATGKEKKR